MCNKGILVVSFGTMHIDTRVKTIEAIENSIKNEFSDYNIYRAFTSITVIRHIEKQEHIYILDVEEAILQMLENGIEEIIIQPTHIIKGIEYEKIFKMVTKYKDKFRKFAVGKPLLNDENDYIQSAKIIFAEMGKLSIVDNKEHAFVLMGHGSEYVADSSYTNLQEELIYQGYENIFIATIKGTPNIENIINFFRRKNFREVTLMPFMIVAGGHANSDMAGDDEDSWKSLLKKEGYKVNCVFKGLGEIKEIRDMFIQHIKDVM